MFLDRGDALTADGQALPRIEVPRWAIKTYRALLSDRENYHSVVACWHDRDRAERSQVRVGEGEPVLRLKHIYATKATAKRGAERKLRSLKRGGSTLSLTLIGDPGYAAETRIRPLDLRPGLDADWLSTRVSHRLTNSGYQTRIEAQRPNQ